MSELQNYLFVSIISADNDEFGLTEDEKQQIITKYDEKRPWDEILEPIKDIKMRKNLIKIFENEGH